jgi:integrase
MPKRAATKLTKPVVEAARPGQWLWDGGDGGLKGFGLRVTPAGAKTFIIRYRLPSGVQKYARIAAYPALTVDEARGEAKAKLAEVEMGGDPSKDRKDRRDAPTLTELADEYCDPYATSRGLKPRTVKDAKTVLAPILASLGRRKVAEITTVDVRKAHGEAREVRVRKSGATGGVGGEPATGQSPYQANRLLAVLSKMFNLSVELGWRNDNPCRGVRKFPEDQRWRHLSENEVGRLLQACDGYENQNAANAVRLLLFTGARLQEALKAEWQQFDLEEGLWEKPSAHTKQKRQHRLELEGPALDTLRSMREADPTGRFLFPGEPDAHGRVSRARADLKRPWRWIAREASLSGVRLHDLRRTTASFMIDGQASLATVGKALGHTQASTTARYAQMSQTVQREALKGAGERMVALRVAAGRADIVLLAGPRSGTQK